MCRDTSKLWSVLELPPSDLFPATPSSSWIQAPLDVRPNWGPSAELLTCVLPLRPPDCPLLWGGPAPPSPCTWGHATGMFSLTATYRAGHSKGYTKCKIKPNISCSKNRKTFSPLSSTVSFNLSWCFFLFLCYLTSCSFGRGDTHLWGECRPHSTCSSTGVWTANIWPEPPPCPDPHRVGAGEKVAGGKTTRGRTWYKPTLQVPGTSLTKHKFRVNHCYIQNG